MAISTVQELLTSTRKLILEVGVKSDSTYTLQGALDYFRGQVNALQESNPDVEVVAKMLDRRVSEVAITEGVGRGNVYDIYSDAYCTKYSMANWWSLAIDKVGIDSIGDRVTNEINTFANGSLGFIISSSLNQFVNNGSIDNRIVTKVQSNINDGTITVGSSSTMPIIMEHNHASIYLNATIKNINSTFIPITNGVIGLPIVVGSALELGLNLNDPNSYEGFIIPHTTAYKNEDGLNEIELLLKNANGSFTTVFKGYFNSYQAVGMRNDNEPYITYDVETNRLYYNTINEAMPSSPDLVIEMYDGNGATANMINSYPFTFNILGKGINVTGYTTPTKGVVMDVFSKVVNANPLTYPSAYPITKTEVSIPDTSRLTINGYTYTASSYSDSNAILITMSNPNFTTEGALANSGFNFNGITAESTKVDSFSGTIFMKFDELGAYLPTTPDTVTSSGSVSNGANSKPIESGVTSMKLCLDDDGKVIVALA